MMSKARMMGKGTITLAEIRHASKVVKAKIARTTGMQATQMIDKHDAKKITDSNGSVWKETLGFCVECGALGVWIMESGSAKPYFGDKCKCAECHQEFYVAFNYK